MKSNNQINIPQAREAMDKFKMQAASEVGVNLTNGYNGHLTSREAGSVGGQMVKKMNTIRSVKYERKLTVHRHFVFYAIPSNSSATSRLSKRMILSSTSSRDRRFMFP